MVHLTTLLEQQNGAFGRGAERGAEIEFNLGAQYRLENRRLIDEMHEQMREQMHEMREQFNAYVIAHP